MLHICDNVLTNSAVMRLDGALRAGARWILPRRRVHERGEFEIQFSQPARIVSGERHIDGVPDIEPFRVVVNRFRLQRGAVHETEGFVKIGELEGFGDGLSALDQFPSIEFRQRAIARVHIQFVRHVPPRPSRYQIPQA